MTESTEREVLLLEAGPDYCEPAALPEDLADGRYNSMRRHDWGYRHRPTVEQVRFPLPRGKVVGGSSAVNTCIALRGQPADYDEWAARGLPQWSWDHCLPAFKRLETDLDFDDPWHGTAGPLRLRRHTSSELATWQSTFLEACDQRGHPSCDDTNRPGSQGAGPHTMNRIEGRRISAAEAWLTPSVRARDNLSIQPGTQVLRVLTQSRRVTGLEVQVGRQRACIEAKQVVLCAGAIGTPTILLRSGIGPSAELARLGVETVADVPGVGARLLDHPGVAFFMRPKWGQSHREAPLIQTVLRTPSGHAGGLPDLQIQPGSSVPLPWIHLPLVSMMAVVGKPVGHGTIRWQGLRADDRPIIESRFLENETDRAVAMDGLRLALDLVRSPAMRDFGAHFYPSRRTLEERGRLERWIRKGCDSGYHPCGTVPMGSDDDPHAATDGQGRVRGILGLLVADASLMPTIPSANTNLCTLMIGERFGEWLRDEGLGLH